MKYLKVFETDTDQQNYINGEFDRPNITVVRHQKQTINYIAKLPTPKLISFTIDAITYNALEGMTFIEWCESTYNIDGYIYEPIHLSGYRLATSDGSYISINRTWVDASDIIQKDGKYIVGLYNLITFFINRIEYQAEEGMTFYDWALSDYYDSSCNLYVLAGGNSDLRNDIINGLVSRGDSIGIYYGAGVPIIPDIYTDTIIQPIGYTPDTSDFD